jgi:hypothetical protein
MRKLGIAPTHEVENKILEYLSDYNTADMSGIWNHLGFEKYISLARLFSIMCDMEDAGLIEKVTEGPPSIWRRVS